MYLLFIASIQKIYSKLFTTAFPKENLNEKQTKIKTNLTTHFQTCASISKDAIRVYLERFLGNGGMHYCVL